MENKELNLCEILKDCPKGTKLYSTVFGEVKFDGISDAKEDKYPIMVSKYGKESDYSFTLKSDGIPTDFADAECYLFPSRDNRDWSTWKNPKPKVERFDPKTFEPFDKVLVREDDEDCWIPTFISYFDRWLKKIITVSDQAYSRVIPYNDDTKHLIGTCDEAPEYYRYWEN